jgi:hypothetical protein
MGWATGTFGLFGLDSNEIKTPWLNYLGISLAVLSVGLYAFVKPTVKKIGKLHSRVVCVCVCVCAMRVIGRVVKC